MKKQVSLSLLLTVVFIAMTLTFSITMIIAMNIFDRTVSSTTQKALMYEKIQEIDAVVRQNYLNDVPADLIDKISAGYITGIQDRYSRYYTAEQYTQVLNRLSGKILGIGVDIVKETTTGYAKVIRVYAGSPAEEVGIGKGWLIVEINGQETKSLSTDTITSYLQGELGTQLELRLLNGSEEQTITIIRKAFELTGIEYEMRGEVGYIRITRVNKSTAAQFDYAVQQLIDAGAGSFVFDVRSVTSTDFEEVARMLDVLCPAGTLMTAQYKDGTTKVLYTSGQTEVNLPMVCITNGTTGAAMEAFCQVLKDYNKARTVGTVTAGRGSIQTTYRLSDGSAIEITTALLLTPKRGLYEGAGVTPDYEAALTAAQEAGFYEMTMDEDPQIQRAFEVAQGMVKPATSSTSGGNVGQSTASSEETDDSTGEDTSEVEDSSTVEDAVENEE